MIEMTSPPTDNLYKFMSIGGLTLIVTAVFLFDRIVERHALIAENEIEFYRASDDVSLELWPSNGHFPSVIKMCFEGLNATADELGANTNAGIATKEGLDALSDFDEYRFADPTKEAKSRIDSLLSHCSKAKSMLSTWRIAARDLRNVMARDSPPEAAKHELRLKNLEEELKLAVDQYIAVRHQGIKAERSKAAQERQGARTVREISIYKYLSAFLFSVGVLLSGAGFSLWAFRFQRQQDRLLLIERRKAELDFDRFLKEQTGE